MEKTIQMAKKIDNQLVYLNPRTSADCVYMASGEETVEDAIGAIRTDILAMKTKLGFDSVFMQDSNGADMTDTDGTKLVAVY